MAVTQQGNVPAGLLNRPQTRLADEVAHLLRDLILRGELEPGSQLLQIQLAERLGVSRTPLREAFRILERDGLLKISNGNKTVEVVEFDRGPLIETYQVREVIDGLAARLAARRDLSTAAPTLERAIERMEAAAEPGLDITEYGEAHAEFHLAILEASGNSRLKDFESLVRISAQMQLTRYLKQNYDEDLDAAISDAIRVGNEHHREILTAITNGDSRAAERSATRHIRATIKFLEGLPEPSEASAK
ncbi:GntR family transcriptional regulator [Actinomadura physcomitrii]|uniref:GntR family transcriptional regulator n=1 Tax=Actinomadura physcomitrii TaxID=2650748 RepID=UPI00136E6CA3|nr:GntR family transcriptional regulator [Actinomadura physcomitrii]